MAISVFMFSLAGIPLMAGFFAKLYIFLAAVKAGLWTLAVIGVLTSVVGAFYYIRIIKVMYFDAPAEAFDRRPPALSFVVAATGLFTAFFFCSRRRSWMRRRWRHGFCSGKERSRSWSPQGLSPSGTSAKGVALCHLLVGQGRAGPGGPTSPRASSECEGR